MHDGSGNHSLGDNWCCVNNWGCMHNWNGLHNWGGNDGLYHWGVMLNDGLVAGGNRCDYVFDNGDSVHSVHGSSDNCVLDWENHTSDCASDEGSEDGLRIL